MSVFTRVDRSTLEHFLAGFDVGELTHFKGISEGIENTNYFVTTSKAEFVLTLVEQWEASEVPYFIELMDWLAARAIPCARPIPNRDGATLHSLLGRPAALVERLRGESTEEPTADNCAKVGAVLARMHLVSADFSMHRNDQRGMQWRESVAQTLYPVIEAADASMLHEELAHHRAQDWRHLSNGVVHADLFPDNVLFNAEDISGVIDFYYACNFYHIYDLAITVNQWCTRTDGALSLPRTTALLRAYHQYRPIDTNERDAWPDMLRYAALRFWISRLKDKIFPKQGLLTTIKDPDTLKFLLAHRKDNASMLRAQLDQALAA
jgi:homoserine kinase type II